MAFLQRREDFHQNCKLHKAKGRSLKVLFEINFDPHMNYKGTILEKIFKFCLMQFSE